MVTEIARWKGLRLFFLISSVKGYCRRDDNLLQILSEDLSQVVSVQGPGSYFGELGFLFGAPRMSTIRAATHCQLVMLNKLCMDKVLEHFPLIAK